MEDELDFVVSRTCNISGFVQNYNHRNLNAKIRRLRTAPPSRVKPLSWKRNGDSSNIWSRDEVLGDML